MQYSIFALELAARTAEADPLREALRRLIEAQSAAQTAAEKAETYAQAAEILGRHLGQVDFGCWDYFDDHHRAVTDFAMWSDGMLGEEGVRAEPHEGAQERYLTFTMAFLIARGSASDRRLAARCDIDDEELWQRAVFARMLENVKLIDLADVRADVVYLIPGDPAYALTRADLRRGKFDHLRELA